MSKFYGSVGFGLPKEVETSPGVWELVTVEQTYYGDVLQNSFRQQNSGNVNDDTIITNRISILADPYAIQNFTEMKYVTWKNQKWKIASVEEQFPRLILNLGGLYVEQN